MAKRITTAELNERINGMDSRITGIEALLREIAEAVKNPTPAPAPEPTPTPAPDKKKDSEFIKHLRDLHSRTDEEKQAAKDEWHAFYDKRWEAWHESAEFKALKRRDRSAANAKKHAEIVAEWRNRK